MLESQTHLLILTMLLFYWRKEARGRDRSNAGGGGLAGGRIESAEAIAPAVAKPINYSERARPPPLARTGRPRGPCRPPTGGATTQLINRNFSRSFLRHF